MIRNFIPCSGFHWKPSIKGGWFFVWIQGWHRMISLRSVIAQSWM